MPSGVILDVSICVKVSVVVVDQFPFLWDFVLTGETENNEYTGVPTDFCLLTRAHRLCLLQIKTKEISENLLNRFCISFIHSLSYDLGLRLGLRVLRLHGREA